jgi:serine/threonine-protein kinase RsbW
MTTAGANDRHRVVVDATAVELAGLRRWASAILEGFGASASAIGDVELAVSELATNVIQHAHSSTITVTIERREDSVVLEVDDADGLPDIDIDDPSLPPASARIGRGLFVVDSVMDSVALVTTGGSRTIRCRRRLH